jgi:hypothetical protein
MTTSFCAGRIPEPRTPLPPITILFHCAYNSAQTTLYLITLSPHVRKCNLISLSKANWCVDHWKGNGISAVRSGLPILAEVGIIVPQWHPRAVIRFNERGRRISENTYNTGRSEALILPLHVFPSPVKPDLHLQVKAPIVFVQIAFVLSQSSVLRMHSFASENQTKQINGDWDNNAISALQMCTTPVRTLKYPISCIKTTSRYII